MHARLGFLFAAAFATANLLAQSVPPPRLAIGTMAPDFTAVRADNSAVKLSSFRGQTVLVDFWATWCGPCKTTMPHLEKLHQQFGARGLVVLGVCVLDDRKKFTAWQKKPEVPTSYLKVFDPAGRSVDDSIATKLYDVSSIPTFFLVDAAGKILFVGVGAGPETAAALEHALAAAGLKP